MLLGLDHLVVAVTDPEAAAAELERVIGLACTGGGRHPLWGTFNRLAWLGDTYVELIGLFDRALAPNGAVSRAVAAALDAGHVGLVSYAVATDGVDVDLGRLRAGGSDLGDVEARSRTRPDGEVVRWRAAFPPSLGPTEPPFIVEHERSGSEWGASARATRASQVHPLGGTARITVLELAVPNVVETADAYARTVGIEFADRDGRGAVAVVGSQAIRLRGGAPFPDPALVEIAVTPAPGVRPAPLRELDALGTRWRIRS